MPKSAWLENISKLSRKERRFDDWENYNRGEYQPPKKSRSGRRVKKVETLVQDRIEGIPKVTPQQRMKKLRDTLTKARRLTEQLLQRMDKGSEDEDSEDSEDDLSLTERMARNKQKKNGDDKAKKPTKQSVIYLEDDSASEVELDEKSESEWDVSSNSETENGKVSKRTKRTKKRKRDSDSEEEMALSARIRYDRRKKSESETESDSEDERGHKRKTRVNNRRRQEWYEQPDSEDETLIDRIRGKRRQVAEANIVQEKIKPENWKQFHVYGRRFENRSIPPEQPLLISGCIMKPYQLDGLRWINNLRTLGANGILADEMGLGKTLQTIALFCHLYVALDEPGPFLVVCPLSTISNWVKEVNRFAPAVPCVMLYPKMKVINEYWGILDETVPCPELEDKQIGKIYITSYETCVSLKAMLEEVNWCFVVVDEGQRIKNKSCRLVQSLKCLDSTNRLLLTGTPLQNNMGELWSLLNFLQPGIFDDYEIFETWFDAKTLHEDNDEKLRLVEQEENSSILASIHSIIRPFLLRRTKAEVDINIPPKREVIVYCPFTSQQAEQYVYTRRDLIKVKERAARDGGGMGMYQAQYFMDLRTAVNHPYIRHDPGHRDNRMIRCCGKLRVLDQMLTRLIQDGHKVLVFSQMTRLLDLIGDYLKLKSIKYVCLDGRIPYLERQENIEKFTKKEDIKVFLLSTRAGGLGINLTAADTVIIYDSDWNPQQDLQAQDRVHRIGQTRPVMIYRLVTKDTIDQVMVERAQAKRTLERLVVHKEKFKGGAENLKSTSKDLDSKELLEMLAAEEQSLDIWALGHNEKGLEDETLVRLLDRTGMEVEFGQFGDTYDEGQFAVKDCWVKMCNMPHLAKSLEESLDRECSYEDEEDLDDEESENEEEWTNGRGDSESPEILEVIEGFKVDSKEEKNIVQMLEERNYISNMKPKSRTKEQAKTLARLQYRLKTLDQKVGLVLNKFPHLKKKAPMTPAERQRKMRNSPTKAPPSPHSRLLAARTTLQEKVEVRRSQNSQSPEMINLTNSPSKAPPSPLSQLLAARTTLQEKVEVRRSQNSQSPEIISLTDSDEGSKSDADIVVDPLD